MAAMARHPTSTAKTLSQRGLRVVCDVAQDTLTDVHQRIIDAHGSGLVRRGNFYSRASFHIAGRRTRTWNEVQLESEVAAASSKM